MMFMINTHVFWSKKGNKKWKPHFNERVIDTYCKRISQFALV